MPSSRSHRTGTKIDNRLENFRGHKMSAGVLLQKELETYLMSGLDFDSALILTLNFYIMNIELGLSFFRKCGKIQSEVKIVMISIGSGLFESQKMLKERNMSLIKMCACATAISGINNMLNQMITFQDLSNNKQKTKLTRSMADIQVAVGLTKIKKYCGFVNETLKDKTKEVSTESSPTLKDAIQLIKDVLSSGSGFTRAYLEVMNLFDSSYNQEKKYEEDVYNEEDLRQEIINLVPNTVLGVQDLDQHLKAYALTTYDGKILIDLKFLEDENQSEVKQIQQKKGN